MLLYYIRHGDPVYEPDSLTSLGQEQARAVAKRLALHGIDRIYTSASERAIQTAQPLCQLMKKEPTVLDWCTEDRAFSYLHITDAEGKRRWGLNDPDTKKLFISRELTCMGDSWYDHPAFQGTRFREGIEHFGRETDALLESLGYRRDESLNCYQAAAPTEERVALFAHWGAGGAILSHILGIPYPQFSTHFTMGHSAVTVVEFREVDGMVIPKALTYANDSHLYREGLPTKFANRIYI